VRPWREDPRFQRIKRELDGVLTIDNHAHLLAKNSFSAASQTEMPLLLQYSNPDYARVLQERLRLVWDNAHPARIRRGRSNQRGQVPTPNTSNSQGLLVGSWDVTP
jgi:hypothetical protein